MCGLAGVVSWTRDPRLGEAAARMAAQLGHRGPDGEGGFVCRTGHAALQHRRLAIIDLVSGDQPMQDTLDGRYTVVLNGEIYNYRELRREAEARGYRFRTESDTEVILAGYVLDGRRSIPALRGMFAFAVWDAAERSLVLVRDRFGKKPLFYAQHGGRLYFASEIKALLAAMSSPIDAVALAQYLRLGYVPGVRTLYRDIRRVPPGHLLHVAADGSTILHRFWELPRPDAPEVGRTTAEWVSRIHDLLAESVQLRLVSDVPLGAFLSGGLDSSTVVALAASRAGHPFHTFSIRPVGGNSADAEAARHVAAVLGTLHHEAVLECPSPDELLRLVSHFDEPFADSSLIPTAAVSRTARQHVTVALSGDGADELFGGYGLYGTFERLDRLARWPLVRAAAGLAARGWPSTVPGWSAVSVVGAPDAERYLRLVSQPWGVSLRSLARLGPADLEQADAELRELFCYPTPSPRSDAVARAQWIDAARAYLAGDILTKVDMASMAFGLEVRAPYLDHLLAQELMRLPVHLRWHAGTGKVLLRQIAARYLPREIIDRQKVGFTVPLEAWLAGPLAPLVHDYLREPRAAVASLLDVRLARAVLDDSSRPSVQRARLTFALLSLAVWAERGQPVPAAAAA